MRIVYLAPSHFPNPKSHSIQILETCHALARAGAQVELTVERIEGDSESALAHYGLAPHPNLAFRRLAPRGSHINKWSGRTFAAYLGWLVASRKLRGGNTCFYLRGTGKALSVMQSLFPFARALGVPIVYELHAVQYLDLAGRHGGRYGEGEKLQRFLADRRDLEGRTYRRLNGLVTISGALRDLVREEFSVQCPMLVVPSGVPAPAPPDTASRSRDIDVCYVGSLYEFNGVDLLVEAMAEVPGKNLAVVGSGEKGDLERVRETARRAGVEDRVQFLGHLPHADAMAWLARSRAVVAPLRKGSLDRVERYCSPAKLFEYMASGATIIASRLPSTEEILTHDRNAILVEPNSASTLATGLRAALSDHGRAAALSRQAREDVTQYTFDSRAGRILDFLHSLC